jgi:hypothetical protein
VQTVFRHYSNADSEEDPILPRYPRLCRECRLSFGHSMGCPEADDLAESDIETLSDNMQND